MCGGYRDDRGTCSENIFRGVKTQGSRGCYWCNLGNNLRDSNSRKSRGNSGKVGRGKTESERSWRRCTIGKWLKKMVVNMYLELKL